MDTSSPVTIVKTAPSDDIAIQILTDWFKEARPSWKLPADICVGTFFLAASIYFLSQDPIPFFFWLALPGALMCFFIAIGYIPLLVKASLKTNKRFPSYYKQKTYHFYPHHLIFQPEGEHAIEIPYDRFTKIKMTDIAVMFLVKEKLALWFSIDDIPNTELQIIISFLEKSNAPIEKTRT